VEGAIRFALTMVLLITLLMDVIERMDTLLVINIISLKGPSINNVNVVKEENANSDVE